MYLFIEAAIIAGLSSVEWGSVNSVGLHIAEWIVEVYDLCVLLEWGIMYTINLQ